jgi:hypothetical protein
VAETRVEDLDSDLVLLWGSDLDVFDGKGCIMKACVNFCAGSTSQQKSLNARLPASQAMAALHYECASPVSQMRYLLRWSAVAHLDDLAFSGHDGILVQMYVQ